MAPTTTLITDHNTVHVWWASLDIDGNALNTCRALLSNEERPKVARFCAERDALHYIAVRGCLRLMLGRYLGVAPQQLAFVYGIHGKPRLRARGGVQQLEFNLSHSGGIALCAVARQRRIGVDVERQRDIAEWLSIAQTYFAREELDSLASLSPADEVTRFIKLWTQKEAYIKGLGRGLSYPLQQFCIPYSQVGEPVLFYDRHDPQQQGRWQFHDLHLSNDHLATIAVEGAGCLIQLNAWTW
ncbi:MAG: 4'-phosphopantetheinyl transferase superfamily protein [Pseudomonadota bacterium]|nr:4'-phosphopantetheinyl transferase superfamily protein [Pseudomonadota bacterium]